MCINPATPVLDQTSLETASSSIISFSNQETAHVRKSCHKQHSWQNPSIENGKIKTYQGKMPVGWTTWAKNPPCLLSARPVKTSFSFFFTQLGETITVEIKLLLELSIRHTPKKALCDLGPVFGALAADGHSEWMENDAALSAEGKPSK